MTALVLSLLLGADPTTAVAVGKLKLAVPADWVHEDGTERWESPAKDALFELSVGQLEKKRKALECVDALTEAVGKGGWEKLIVGKAPAAKKTANDTHQPSEEGAKPVE